LTGIFLVLNFQIGCKLNRKNPILASIAILTMLLWPNSSQAQKFEWVNFFQGQNTQSPVSMSVDNAGNQYASFYFLNEIKFDTIYLKNYNNFQKCLVVKQNSDGKVLWRKVVQGTTQSAYALASRFNNKGNLLVFIASTSDLKVGPDTVKRKGSSGSTYAYFLLEFSDTGKFINGTHLIDGSLVNLSYNANKITSDKSDNLYFCLAYTGQVKVYDSTGTTNIGSSTSGSRNMILKFANSGKNYKWNSTLPYSNVIVNSLKVDIHENVYVVGYWTGLSAISFKGKSLSNPQSGTGAVFIWDKNGNDKQFFYVKASDKVSTLSDITVYDSNSVFISGAYQGDSALFDTVWKKNKKFGAYLFFAKYDINGKLKWVKIEDTTYSTVVYPYNYYSGMANYKDAFVYLSIYIPYHYKESVIFDGQKYPAKPNGYGINFKADDKGNILWGYRTFYPFSSMGTDQYENFYFQGGWSGDTIRFGNIKAYPNSSDGFIGKTTDYSITRGNVFAGPYCAGDTIKVPFTKQGDFDTSNFFIAELSDEFGVFDGNERELGRVKSTKDSIVIGKFPLFKTASSGNYRIRIISSNPIVQSFYKVDKLRLLVYSRDKADPGPTEAICFGDTLKLNTYGGTKWTWSPKYNMSDSNRRQPLVWPLKDTTYKIIIADSSGCGEPDTAYKKIIIRKPLKLTLAFNDTTVCDTLLLKLPMHFAGGDTSNYEWKAYDITSTKKWILLKSRQFKLKDTLQFLPKVKLGVTQKLAVVFSDNCTNKSDTAYLNIQLLAPSVIANKYKDTLICLGNSIQRKAISKYALNTYQWQWLNTTTNQVVSTSDTLNIKPDKTTRIKLTLTNGCTIDSNIFTIKVNPPLNAEMRINSKALRDTNICYGQVLNLQSFGSGGNNGKYYWEWYLDNKLISLKDTINFKSSSFFTNTNATKTLMMVLKDQCTVNPDTISRKISVLEAPVANFSNGVICNRSVTDFKFTGVKSGSGAVFNWDFDGEGTSNLENPSKLLSNFGIKNISLSVTLANGCRDKITKPVFVNVQSKAGFNVKDTCDNDSTIFVNQSKDATNYKWYFGDGVNSNGVNVKHKYSRVNGYKTYNVKLVALLPAACSDSITKLITINESPIAYFAVNDVCEGVTSNFYFTGNVPSKPINSNYEWNFNNESTSTQSNPVVKFNGNGVKTVSLKVSTSNGCVDSISQTTTVKKQSKADFSVNDVCENDSVVFQNLSKDATAYTWKMGDGNILNMESPKYFYKVNGKTVTYNVTLVASVLKGCADSITKAITVNENPISDFTYSKSGSKLDLKAVQITNSKYLWKFDGTDSVLTSTPNYLHTITGANPKQVCLIATNLAGCTSQTCKNILLGKINFLESAGIKLYPNPNSGNFYIETTGNIQYSVEVFNHLGQIIYKSELNVGISNLNLNLPAGVYVVKVVSGNSLFIQNIVVGK
jgi:PKD repeat protein